MHQLASTLRNEYCIKVIGEVKARPDNQVNDKMVTGSIEVYAKELVIFNKSKALPLDFNQENTEEQRLRYRYLDLRRERCTRCWLQELRLLVIFAHS